MARAPAAPTDDEARPDHAALVRAAQRGDRAAFARLYDQFEPVVRSIAMARVSPEQASDVLHDVFVTVLVKLPALRDPAAFPGWLASIARNRAVDHARRAPVAPVIDESAFGVVSLDERALGVLRAIQSLPDTYSETLVMRFVEGMTGPEIARATGRTHTSVRVNLWRGMKLLRQRLGEGGPHVG